MLPAPARLHASRDFTDVMRRGRRSGAPMLTLHVLPPDAPVGEPVRAGLVVSKAVGNAVVRHRVSRRIRHLLGPRLDRVAPGTRLVVRAAPAAAQATSADLARDLELALSRVAR
ncbi:MAG: ribonuclease protein component [Frankiales bacterium]|nr:ribonuclease protein component [Frankiales bacterium]